MLGLLQCGISAHVVLVRQHEPTKHLAPGVPSDFCLRWCWHSPRCITARSNRTLASMRNSMWSNGAHSGPSLVVSHSAFSSPPSWERRAAESARGSLRVAASARGCFQLACLFLNAWFPTRATFIYRLGESSLAALPLSLIDRPIRLSLSCESLAASTSPSVSIARTPEAFATLGAIARYFARKAIGDRRSVDVASNSPAFLGNRILLMAACLSWSCPTNKGNKASTISSSSCAYEARASGGTTQQSND